MACLHICHIYVYVVYMSVCLSICLYIQCLSMAMYGLCYAIVCTCTHKQSCTNHSAIYELWLSMYVHAWLFSRVAPTLTHIFRLIVFDPYLQSLLSWVTNAYHGSKPYIHSLHRFVIPSLLSRILTLFSICVAGKRDWSSRDALQSGTTHILHPSSFIIQYGSSLCLSPSFSPLLKGWSLSPAPIYL